MLEQVQDFFSDGKFTDIVVPFLINLLLAIGIYLVGKWISVHIVRLIDKLLVIRNIDQALRGFISAVLSALFTFVVILIAVEKLGINITSLLAILGAAGLAVGLALKDSLSNFAAGVMLIFFKPFKIGDYVDAGGTSGTIEGITIFHTLMTSIDNKQIIVPNSRIYDGTITNYSAKPTRRIDLVIGIGYGDDMKKARELILQAIRSDERLLTDPEPLVAVDELGDSSVNLVVRPWVATADYWGARRALVENIKTAFDAHGVSIPFPQRDVHLYKAGE